MNFLHLFLGILFTLFFLILTIYVGVNSDEFVEPLIRRFGKFKGNTIFIFSVCALISALITIVAYIVYSNLPDSVGYLSLIAVFL